MKCKGYEPRGVDGDCANCGAGRLSHEPREQKCDGCGGSGRIKITPDQIGWKCVGPKKWQMNGGKVFTFTEKQTGVLLIPCPVCTVLAA